jgi:hypothetical protein
MFAYLVSNTENLAKENSLLILVCYIQFNLNIKKIMKPSNAGLVYNFEWGKLQTI